MRLDSKKVQLEDFSHPESRSYSEVPESDLDLGCEIISNQNLSD